MSDLDISREESGEDEKCLSERGVRRGRSVEVFCRAVGVEDSDEINSATMSPREADEIIQFRITL